MKLGAGLAVLALTFAVMSADGGSPRIDPFLEQHAAAIAKNIYGGFSIRFTDGRRTFHAREPIEIELVYERGAQFTVQPADGPESLLLTRAQFDRPVDAPLRIVDSKFGDRIPSGVSGCLTYAPIVVRRTLNHLYRFDAPGRYRMFVQSRQVTPEFETSNILEFEIVARDAAWERDVLTRAEAALARSTVDKRTAFVLGKRAIGQHFQLAPHEGRVVMRTELQRDRPRVSMETFAMLPVSSGRRRWRRQRLKCSRIRTPGLLEALRAPYLNMGPPWCVQHWSGASTSCKRSFASDGIPRRHQTRRCASFATQSLTSSRLSLVRGVGRSQDKNKPI